MIRVQFEGNVHKKHMNFFFLFKESFLSVRVSRLVRFVPQLVCLHELLKFVYSDDDHEHAS